jgi:hypothetical protein
MARLVAAEAPSRQRSRHVHAIAMFSTNIGLSGLPCAIGADGIENDGRE